VKKYAAEQAQRNSRKQPERNYEYFSQQNSTELVAMPINRSTYE